MSNRFSGLRSVPALYAALVTTPRALGRPTIRDVADRAGVSISAASYALNGRPGVSATTRDRILAAAEALGWLPDSSARRLASSRSETIGLVLPTSTADSFGVAPWFMEFISGIESVLAERGFGLLLQVVPDRDAELAVYSTWTRSRRVDGAILVDIAADDPRVAAAPAYGFPVVVAGPPDQAAGLPCVWTDDEAAVSQAVRYLAALGHRRLARIAGPPELAHIAARQRAFDRAAVDADLEVRTWSTGFAMEVVRSAVREIVTTRPRPTALLFDDDLGAVLALGVAHEMGIAVPGDLSLLAWDDSLLCRSTYPQLSAMSHDVRGYGAHVARLLFATIEGAEPAIHLDTTPRITPRGTTAPPAPPS